MAYDYKGSSFNEIIEVLQDQKIPRDLNPEAHKELGVYQSKLLPLYPPFVSETIVEDAERTLTDRADWYERLVKRIHGNGICFSGTWEMDQHTNHPYTGYFKQGSKGLFIGRVSTTTNGTLGGAPRTFGFAGKIFPTLDPNKVVKTENFFTVDALLGTRTPRFSQVVLSNRPVVFSGLWDTDWYFIFQASQVNGFFEKADRNPKERPLTNVAKIDSATIHHAPHVIEITTSLETPTADYNEFRHELNFNFIPQKKLILNILAGDKKSEADEEKINLQKIGQIQLDQSFISYGCDRQLHFSHPKED